MVSGEDSLSATSTLDPLTHTQQEQEERGQLAWILSLAAAGEILATCPTFLPLDTVHTCIKAWPPLARDKRSRNSTHLRRYTISWKLLVAQR